MMVDFRLEKEVTFSVINRSTSSSSSKKIRVDEQDCAIIVRAIWSITHNCTGVCVRVAVLEGIYIFPFSNDFKVLVLVCYIKEILIKD